MNFIFRLESHSQDVSLWRYKFFKMQTYLKLKTLPVRNVSDRRWQSTWTDVCGPSERRLDQLLLIHCEGHIKGGVAILCALPRGHTKWSTKTNLDYVSSAVTTIIIWVALFCFALRFLRRRSHHVAQTAVVLPQQPSVLAFLSLCQWTQTQLDLSLGIVDPRCLWVQVAFIFPSFCLVCSEGQFSFTTSYIVTSYNSSLTLWNFSQRHWSRYFQHKIVFKKCLPYVCISKCL